MKQCNAADADRADRVAMIGLVEPEEALLLGMAGELPELEGLLERDLDGGGARVGIEHALQAVRGDLEERRAEANRWLVAES